MTLLSRRKRQTTAPNTRAARATDAPYSASRIPLLLVVLFVFGSLPTWASDWTPRSQPLQRVVFDKQQSSRPTSDGWKSQHAKKQTSANRAAIRLRSRSAQSAQVAGAASLHLQDPFGDQSTRDATQSNPESRVALADQSDAAKIEGARQMTTGQIRNSTFQFVKQRSTAANPPVVSTEVPRIKLTFSAPTETRPPGPMTIIEATSYHPLEVAVEASSDTIPTPPVMARYEQSILADSELPADLGAKQDDVAGNLEKFPLQTSQKTKTTEGITNQVSSEPADPSPPRSIVKSGIDKPVNREEKTRTLTPIGPSDADKSNNTSVLSTTTETESPDSNQTAENQNSNTDGLTENTLPGAVGDVSRPEPPPFESLDLDSDEQLIERESKAMEAEIDAAIAAGKNAYERDCRLSREYLLNRTLADISLNISVAGVPGADFPVSCDIETQQIPLNSYHFGRQEPLNFAWTASGLCHKPLYFRELQAERYGHSIGRISQPFLSAAHFFCNVAILPYNMGMRPPQECVYALGHYWPGDPAPRYIPAVPISLRGGLMQAGAVLGAVYVLP
ncbi:MAG: hypothetical protein VXZ84_10150 [Planctomycetota bacterium]|nr:hypothetical protein [Planctomycetota bacterium]